MAHRIKDKLEEEALVGLMGASDTCTGSFLSAFNTSRGRVLDILEGGAACAGYLGQENPAAPSWPWPAGFAAPLFITGLPALTGQRCSQQDKNLISNPGPLKFKEGIEHRLFSCSVFSCVL